MAWVVLLASAAAVLIVGAVATLLALSNLNGPAVVVGPALLLRFVGASALTVASLGLRSLRWIFLLRRAGTRIPIRDAYIGYFAGLSLLLAPLLLGEISIRALVLRARGAVPIASTVLVSIWERFGDVVAIALIAASFSIALDGVTTWNVLLIAAIATTAVKPVRRLLLNVVAAVSSRAAAIFEKQGGPDVTRLNGNRAWLSVVVTSVAAWLIPGVGLWLIAGTWGDEFSVARAELTYAASTGVGGVEGAPGGVIVAGSRFLSALASAGFTPAKAALVVLAIRMATVGVATVLGVVFVALHLWSPRSELEAHFDAIADAYDVQIPERRRLALLERKTVLMRDILQRLGLGRVGLDVGCGQGAYVERMRALGFAVNGIDASAGQVALAARKSSESAISLGSVLDIPAKDGSCDFVYIINVLHHLASVEEQRLAFAELMRVLRPGGVLFVHEINTRNLLFRFYMGYIFPSLNCIDEGVERWLLPHKLAMYTDAAVTDVRYFTFLPDFLAPGLVTLLAPLERWLEASPLRVYSAHYMAVIRKSA